jgi:UDP-galactopyranose mutase
MKKYDLVIVGAGPVGCVVAERAANILNWKVLIIEKRSHLAGNCFDSIHESGVMVHNYGPHYFRTNSKELLSYLSRFTEWIDGNYIVKSFSGGKYYSFPINLTTLSDFFSKDLNEESAIQLLEDLRVKIKEPQNSEEFVLSRVGRELYEAFYLGYTLKQWELHPIDLDPSVCGRIPIRLNHDQRYVDHKYQFTPKDGFTKLFTNMINSPNIELRLETDFFDIKKELSSDKPILYTGPIDLYFNHQFGVLPWRSLEFDFKVYNEDYMQECVQINYPNDFDYTRSVEIKHVTRQVHPNTVISFEYPKANGDPYYPIPAKSNKELFKQYWELATKETIENGVYFAGRLARYAYINTDEAVEEGLKVFDQIKQRYEKF